MIAFTAHGIPKTQGSARAFVQGGRAFVAHASGDKLLSWRSVVTSEAMKAIEAAGVKAPVFDCPVRLEVTFRLPRPKGAPKRRFAPDRKPDLDKLLRAVGDGLSGIVYADDARICEIVVCKTYGSPPGVDVRVMAQEPPSPRGLDCRPGEVMETSLASEPSRRMKTYEESEPCLMMNTSCPSEPSHPMKTGRKSEPKVTMEAKLASEPCRRMKTCVASEPPPRMKTRLTSEP